AAEGSIEPSHVHAVLAQRTPQPPPEPAASNRTPPTVDATSLRESERRSILAALQATAWNKSAAARRLGISRPTLHKKIKEYELKP
ncbi:MAG: helix-turn-helix domain-containing protein, partial [Verrucomicrobiota bacterium]|nr:helix-turn-helix domain-containing protein [Verrucomicrobiota bacterium]